MYKCKISCIFLTYVSMIGLLISLTGCTPIDQRKSKKPSQKTARQESARQENRQENTRWANIEHEKSPRYPAMDITVGFRGIQWGTNLHNISGLTKETSYSSDSIYDERFIREYEWQFLGELLLTDLSYGQFNGQFYCVHMDFEASSYDIRKTFRSLFGYEWEHKNDNFNFCEWNIGTCSRYNKYSNGYYDGALISITHFYDNSVCIYYNPGFDAERAYSDNLESSKSEIQRRKATADFYGN